MYKILFKFCISSHLTIVLYAGIYGNSKVLITEAHSDLMAIAYHEFTSLNHLIDCNFTVLILTSSITDFGVNSIFIVV